MKSKFFKIAVSACFFIVSAHICFGQKAFLLGVKGGIDIPNLSAGSGAGSNPVSQGWSSRLGPYFGIVVMHNLSHHFSLQAELNYSSQGGKKNGKQAIPTSDFTTNPPPGTPQYIYANINSETKLNYIELPILARVDLPLGSKLKFFINAGPYFGYLVAAKDVVTGTSNVYADEAETMPLLPQAIPLNTSQDVKSDIKKFNMGIQGGIGLAVNAPLGSIMIAIGGNYGFIPIQKDKANGQNNTGAANFTLGYLFKL